MKGDILPFKMTAEQRKIAVEKSKATQTPEYEGVRLFRAKLEPKAPKPPAERPKTLTRTCACCGSSVKVKPVKAKRLPVQPPKRWFLYYGPGRMTGGFRTKKEAMNWYLKGGR